MNAPHAFPLTLDDDERRRHLSAWQLSTYRAVRQASEALAAPLSPEDCQAQSMPDASPVKWHLAHTTWFFETFLLRGFAPVAPVASNYVPEFPQYRVLFNSYYNAVGERHPRPNRGLLTRPTLAEVMAYRARVDDAMAALIMGGGGSDGQAPEFASLLALGVNHEQQHQELILTDLKHLLSCNPMGPAYRQAPEPDQLTEVPGTTEVSGTTRCGNGLPDKSPAAFVRFEGGIVTIGHDGPGFCFDNERPSHQVLLRPFELADRLVTCTEYIAFVDAGGYRRPEFWLSLGWDTLQAQDWNLPLYWRRSGGRGADQGTEGSIESFTLRGWQPLDPAAPVAHLSFFEADAYARWADARLPTEAEWEHAARTATIAGGDNLLERGLLRPAGPVDSRPAMGFPGNAGASGTTPLRQLWGDLWEWTASPYVPYPGFKASADAVGEYNGKFMCNQYVLRGGSFSTSRSHIRASYRNFFPADARWQFSGLRLARDPAPRGR